MVREHLAVLKKPYLSAILDGRKTVELRLTRIAAPPFGAIESGDRIWLKQSAGPIVARAGAGHVTFLDRLTPDRIRQLRESCQGHVLATDEFWRSRADCRYATLIRLCEVTAVEPFKPKLLVRTPWLVLKQPLDRS